MNVSRREFVLICLLLIFVGLFGAMVGDEFVRDNVSASNVKLASVKQASYSMVPGIWSDHILEQVV